MDLESHNPTKISIPSLFVHDMILKQRKIQPACWWVALTWFFVNKNMDSVQFLRTHQFSKSHKWKQSSILFKECGQFIVSNMYYLLYRQCFTKIILSYCNFRCQFNGTFTHWVWCCQCSRLFFAWRGAPMKRTSRVFIFPLGCPTSFCSPKRSDTWKNPRWFFLYKKSQP